MITTKQKIWIHLHFVIFYIPHALLGRFKSKSYIYDLKQDRLLKNEVAVKNYDDYGEIVEDALCDIKYFGKGKWENPNHIDWSRSIIGAQELYFRIGTKVFYRYTTAFVWEWLSCLFGKDIWITFSYGRISSRYILKLRVRWEN